MSSRAYRLKTKEGAAEGVRRIAKGRADKALNRLTDLEDSELAAAIHGARKDLKKQRALLRLVREELGRDLFKAENHRYRDAGRLLSGSRDAEVKLETLVALRTRFEAELPAAETALWEAELESERDQIAAAVAEEGAGRIERASEIIDEGRGQIGEWPLRTETWKLVGPGLRRGYRDGRQAMKQARKESSTESVHQWRKRGKDLWYQLRIVQEAWPEVLEGTIEQVHELTDLLGDHHDLAILRADLASRWGVTGKDSFEAAIERRQRELFTAALELGTRIYAEKPKAFNRRLKTYWTAWRGE